MISMTEKILPLIFVGYIQKMYTDVKESQDTCLIWLLMI